MSAYGATPSDHGCGEGGILERILRRLAPAEIVEGVLGDMEETRRSRPGRGPAARVRYAVEGCRLVASFAHERLGRFLDKAGRRLSGEAMEVSMPEMSHVGVEGGLRLWGRWILASLAGWAAGLAAGVLLSAAGEALVGLNPDRFLGFASLASLGLGMGFAQSRVIGPFLPKPHSWVWATAAGHLAAMIVISFRFPNLPGPEVLDLAIFLALLGAAVGGGQWWILRRRFRGAGIWVPATALGFVSFLWIVLNPAVTQAEFVLAGAALGTVASALPGAVLAWFVTQQTAGAKPSGAAAARP